MIRKKKGQFFIITSLIIATILAGLTATINYAVTQPQPVRFYDLSKDFQAESAKIIDFGVLNKTDIEDKIHNFTASFLEYAQERNPNLELVYIYGNKDGVVIENYAHGSGVIKSHSGINETLAGGGEYGISKIEFQVGPETIFSTDVLERMEHFRKIKTQFEKPGDWIRIDIAGEIHDFNLREEDEFLVVMETNTSVEEIHVIQTQEFKEAKSKNGKKRQ